MVEIIPFSVEFPFLVSKTGFGLFAKIWKYFIKGLLPYREYPPLAKFQKFGNFHFFSRTFFVVSK